MRLIDADAIAERIETARENARAFIYNSDFVTMAIAGVNSVSKMIDDAPTVDAVEVVRCKDCKRNGHCVLLEFVKFEEKSVISFYEDKFYCPWGERKDNEVD